MRNSNLDLQASHKMLMMFEDANANTEMVIDQFPGIFLIINANHEILRANREFVTLFDTDSEKIFRRPLASFFRQKSWEIFAHNIKRLTTPGITCDVVRFELGVTVSCDADGEDRPFHWILTRHNVRSRGEGQLITVYGNDMTEIRETEKRLMEVFTSIPLGMFTANRMGRIGSSYSSYLETMLDCGKLADHLVEDVVFNPALESIDADARNGIKAMLNCMGRSELEFPELEKTFPHEIFHNPKPDEKEGRWFKISYHPIINDNVIDQMLIILEDRTEIVKAERDIMSAAKEREKAAIIQLQSQAVYESAIRDPLTGLYTRLYMKDSVASLLASHESGEVAAVSMVIFDIDHFKQVNDKYGHKHGDLVLSRIATVVLKQTRENDIPIRFGGEEFVVFLPATVATATLLAERVRKAVEELDIELDGGHIRVTISGGIALFRPDETLEDFMHRADQCLYKAKEGGRNRNVSET
jgi:diguanylate cyclase (GGDEF)-like protein